MLLKSRIVLAGVLGLAGSFAACSETSDFIEVEKPAPIEATRNFPRVSVKKDTTLALTVFFRPENGCGQFSYVDSTTVDNTSTMTVYASYPDDEDVVCSDISKLISYQFRFTPTTSGKHYFRFWKANNQYLLDSVVVQ